MGRLISYGIYEGEQDESSSISVCFVMPTIDDRESSSTILIGDIVEDDEDLVLYAYNTIEDIYSTMDNKIDKELLTSYIGNTGWDDSNFEINVIDNTEGFVLNNYIIQVLLETQDINNTWTFIAKDLNGNMGSYNYNKSALNIYDIYDNLISNPTSIEHGLYTVVKTGTGVNSRFTIKPFLTNENVNNILTNNYYTQDEIEDLFDDYVPNNMIETTWANLVSLRDNSQLIKGAWYRIIDYNFITSKINVHSGNHQFDIIVLAISESMLSETAYAAAHAGDTYFKREVSSGGIEWLYTLYADNYANIYDSDPMDHSDDIHSADVFCDSDYLEHPDTGDIVPVLYKTNSDEYSFDDPDYDDVYYYEGTYDIDGDEYDMWSKWEIDWADTNELVFAHSYALTPIVVDNNQFIVSPIPESKTVSVNMNAWELKYCLDNDKTLFDWADTNGKGVIYYMKDEFNNEAPYDFKNAQFQRKKITNTINNNLIGSVFINSYLGLPEYYGITCGDSSKYFYTFEDRYNEGSDSSLFGNSNNNTIKQYVNENGQKLINNIVLMSCRQVFIDNNCYNMTLREARNVSLGTSCYNNMYINCSNFVISNSNYNNIFYSSSGCTFGDSCSQNIGNGLSSCSFGYMCRDNIFGLFLSSSTFGIGCNNLTLGTNCYGNTFGDNVAGSTFNNFFSYCKVEGQSSGIRVNSSYVRYCTFKTNLKNITINTSGGSTTSYVQYVTIGSGITGLTIQPTRNLGYEQVWYTTGRIEHAV